MKRPLTFSPTKIYTFFIAALFLFFIISTQNVYAGYTGTYETGWWVFATTHEIPTQSTLADCRAIMDTAVDGGARATVLCYDDGTGTTGGDDTTGGTPGVPGVPGVPGTPGTGSFTGSYSGVGGSLVGIPTKSTLALCQAAMDAAIIGGWTEAVACHDTTPPPPVGTVGTGAGGGGTIVTTGTRGSGDYHSISPLPNTGVVDLDDPSGYFGNLFTIFIVIAASLAVIRLMICGISYMTSESVSVKGEAKTCIQFVLGGLLLILFSVVGLQVINKDFGKLDFTFVTKKIRTAAELSTRSTPGAVGGTSVAPLGYAEFTATEIPFNQYCRDVLGDGWVTVNDSACSTIADDQSCCGLQQQYAGEFTFNDVEVFPYMDPRHSAFIDECRNEKGGTFSKTCISNGPYLEPGDPGYDPDSTNPYACLEEKLVCTR